MKFINRLLPVFIVMALLAIPTFAQSGSVGGKVLDKDGKPLAGATIAIDAVGVTRHLEVKTGKDGKYFYSGLATGMYKISVMNGDTAMASGQTRVTFGGTANADFDLSKAGAAAPAGATPEEKAKAEADAKTAADINKTFNDGVAELQAKHYPEAIALLKEAADKNATQHVIFANLGEAYAGARKYPEAIEAYKKAVELKPDEFGYYNNLGIAYGNAGQIDDAIATLKKASDLNPALAPQAYYNLGAVLSNKGRSKDAADAFRKAIELKPDYAQAYLQLGISLFGTPATMGDAVPVLQKFLTMNPNPTDKDTATQLLAAAQQAAGPATFKSQKAIDDDAKAKAKADADAKKAKKTPSPLVH